MRGPCVLRLVPNRPFSERRFHVTKGVLGASDLEWMKDAYRLTRKDGAPGIDGVTASDYATSASP
jgi:hypothetical protein